MAAEHAATLHEGKTQTGSLTHHTAIPLVAQARSTDNTEESALWQQLPVISGMHADEMATPEDSWVGLSPF